MRYRKADFEFNYTPYHNNLTATCKHCGRMATKGRHRGRASWQRVVHASHCALLKATDIAIAGPKR